jgi:DNA-binding CsgD family transcriptional regulator
VAGILTQGSRLLNRLSTGLAELYLPGGGDFPGRVINLVSSLVPADSCSYNHMAGQTAMAWRIEPADAVTFPDADQLFQQLVPEHPLLRHFLATGDMAARRISDVASDRQFRALALYRDFYRPHGVDHQLVVSVPAPDGGMISVALNRQRRDFSDPQRELIDLLRPHLRQAAAITTLLGQPVPGVPRSADGQPLLTARQTRILQLVAAGQSDRAVARALGISVRTVQTHLQHVYRTLGVSSRTEALAHARALSLSRGPAGPAPSERAGRPPLSASAWPPSAAGARPPPPRSPGRPPGAG